MLTITHQETDGKHIFGLEGRVDAEGANDMERQLLGLLSASNYQLILDLSQTDYLSSAGLRVLADVLTQCRAQEGDVKIAAPNIKVMRVLEIIGFDRFFNIYETIDQAIAAYSA